MTIASEIARLQQAKACMKSSIESKWVTVPSDLKLQWYSDCINCIQQWWSIWDIPFFTSTWSSSWNSWTRWLRDFAVCNVWDYVFFSFVENWYCSSWDAMTANVWYYKKWNKDLWKSSQRDIINMCKNDYSCTWYTAIKVCWNCVYFCMWACSARCWHKCIYSCFNMTNDTFSNWQSWVLWDWYWYWDWWYSYCIRTMRDYDYCLRIYKTN